MLIPRLSLALRTPSTKVRKHHVAALLALLAVLSYAYSERLNPFARPANVDIAQM